MLTKNELVDIQKNIFIHAGYYELKHIIESHLELYAMLKSLDEVHEASKKDTADKLEKAEAELAKSCWNCANLLTDMWEVEQELKEYKTELVELWKVVAWYFECEDAFWWHPGRDDLDCNDNDELAIRSEEYCPYCMAGRELDASFEQSKDELKRLVGGGRK